MGSLSVTDTVPAAGRGTPAAGSGSRFPQLDDAEFWREHRSQTNGAIARLLGCGVSTVGRARKRQGLSSLSVGRPRGSKSAPPPPPPPRPPVLKPIARPTGSTEEQLLARIQSERGKFGVDLKLIGRRALELSQADRSGDPNAVDDALLAVASAVVLVHEHRQKLRRAA